MEPIKRKRVTRVGSGAFSIYLPKKWIDGWLPEQQESREVDLHYIGDSMLIVPVISDHSLARAIEPSKAAVRRWLLSCYVRGVQEAHLTPATGAFDNDAIAAGRDFLRHLDERLIATCTPETIGYTLNRDLPPPASNGHDLLAVMGAKIQEMVELAEGATRAYPADPDRCLHSLALLQSIHQQDASRYFHQAMRHVATIELPLETVSDFQFLDLVAADLHRMADHCVRIAGTLMRAYGLELDDLAYPREHLVKRIGPTRPVEGFARAILHTYPRGFRDARDLLARLMEALLAPDIPALAEINRECWMAQDRVQERIFESVVEHWGEGDVTDPASATQGFSAYQLSVPLTDLMNAMGTTSRHGLGILTAAQPPSP